MSRAADFTIKGFLYQFNKTLLEILRSSDDAIVTVEGIVEDIEVTSSDAKTAIQCKYHEAADTFTPSIIFKPLLQMLEHFHANQAAGIRYILFAHFPSMTEAPNQSTQLTYLKGALDTKNKDLNGLASKLRDKVDLDNFMLLFSMQVGPAFDELVTQVCAALKENGIPEGEIDTLAYPNAINMVAGISVKHDPAERTTTRMKFIEILKSIRKTAISRWTMALKTRKQLLAARRAQLKAHLDTNSRLRYIVIDSKGLEDYDTEVILFMKDYLDKYHFKQVHICTPVLCLCVTKDEFQEIQHRLYQKGIISTDGCIGGHFEEQYFFREPLSSRVSKRERKREFSLRLLRWEEHNALLNHRKCDDLFIIGELNYAVLDTSDVNVEHLATSSFKEVKYMMGVSNVYE
jgi:hypothetical protein